MQRGLSLLITFFIVLLSVSCSTPSKQSWTALIPNESAFLVIPKKNVSVTNLQDAEYAALLDDITSGSAQQIATFAPELTSGIDLKGISIFPSSSIKSDLLWITESNSDIGNWIKQYHRPLSQNYYKLKGVDIHRVETESGTSIFITQVHDWLVFSSSSLAVEAALRSYSGDSEAMDIPVDPSPGQLIMNTPSLTNWVEQFAQVAYRPSLVDAFKGTNAASLLFSTTGDSMRNSYTLSGKITLSDSSRSVLTGAISSKNKPITLDRYIAGNAAAFGVFRLSPKRIPVKPTGRLSDLDSYLLNSNDVYSSIAATLDDEFGFETFSESGLSASGEFLFLRKLKSASGLRNILDNLTDENHISKIGNSYFANSIVLSELIGSEMSPFADFYISFSRDVVVISNRRGLSESVESDRARRRVIFYDTDYSNAKKDIPVDISGFVWIESAQFRKFIDPFLMSENNTAGLLNQFDLAYLTFTRLNQNSIDFSLKTRNKEGSNQPYQELWVTPLFNSDLTGAPVMGDVIGSRTEEVIYATENGTVAAVAADGTVVMQTTTNGSIPIGSPVLYDWYGNGQTVIMLGAGTKIFAWNQNGNLLPNFPIELGERITAPIEVTDVRRNGIPEVIVATEDRKAHVIDGRGVNVSGWPKSVNSIVTSKPVFENVDGTWSIWAFSQNLLHSWLRNGASRPGYPQFINAGFNGSPMIFESSVYGAGSDGKLYSVGVNPSFDDSLATYERMDSISIKSIYVTNNELLSVSIEENVLLKDSTNFYREDLILTQSRNGSVFGFNLLGELHLTESLGQPASTTFIPELADIDSDQNQNLIALAEFGRLFAWEVLTGERFFDLPTSGMKFPIIVDLNGDGEKELIAQTREGLRCWTIFRN